MTPDPIAAHLAAYRAVESARLESEHAAATAREIHSATLAANLSARMKAEALPILESAAESLRGSGAHAIVTIGESFRGAPGPWVIAITFRLECAIRSGHFVSDIGFIAEVDPEQDTWRVRSHVLSQFESVRAAVPDATFFPGSGDLGGFVSARVAALVTAVFPIPLP